MDTPQRIGTITAVALVVAFCTITLSDRQVAAITKVLTGRAPEAWARELEEETTLSETQIHQLLEALAPR
jgi:hypothetical protein